MSTGQNLKYPEGKYQSHAERFYGCVGSNAPKCRTSSLASRKFETSNVQLPSEEGSNATTEPKRCGSKPAFRVCGSASCAFACSERDGALCKSCRPAFEETAAVYRKGLDRCQARSLYRSVLPEVPNVFRFGAFRLNSVLICQCW